MSIPRNKMPIPTEIEKLEELIKGSIEGELVEQKLEPLVPPGENYGSEIYKVDFKVKHGGKIQTYHGVAKCTPSNKIIQEVMNIQQTFKAESAWYTTIVPTIREFQRESGVEQVADFFQVFYGARFSLDPASEIVDMNAVILTENLTPLGFKNVDRHIGFDLKTSKAVLRDLATFHAVPMAIKLINKGLFDKNIKAHLPNFNLKEGLEKADQDMFKNYKKALEEIPECCPFMDRIATYLKNHDPYPKELIINEPWGSICHNDFWINNVMVKDEEKQLKTMFLDFQMFTYGSIALDVIFFLIVSVAQEVVKEKMDELIRYYWDEFLRNLKQLNVDTSLFTFEDYLKEIDNAASSGLFSRALLHTYLILTDRGRSILNNGNEKSMFNQRHKEKYKWLVLEFIKRGWM